ncbi:MAG TPA: hypothetical protein VF521_03160, partial [Pyrinomonadaceae bacterium]
MNRIRQTISVALVVAMLGLGLASAQAQTQRPYRISDRQVENALRRVETDADRFRASFSAALDRSRWNGTSTEDQLNTYVQNFETATDTLRSRFNARNAAASDVENVLRQAAFLNDFMMRNRLDMQAMNDWTTLRADLDALARAYNVTWDWTRQTGSNSGYGNSGGSGPTGVAYRIGDRQLDAIIRRIENGADRFRADMGNALDRSTYNGTRAEDNINQFMRDFENATDTLRSRFNSRNSVAGDVENVLRQATYIDDFMTRQTLSVRAENDWTALKGDLNQLASAYSVAWTWDVRSMPGYGNTTADTNVFGDQRRGGGMRAAGRLTGTFRLDTTQSDNATTVAETAVRNLPYAERDRVRGQLMRRLEAPEMLAIQRDGNSVTIASSRAPQTTFTANAGESREQLPNGSYSRVSSTIQGDRLVVNSTGNRETDFTVTFDPIEGGRRLRVTRQIWNDRLGANPLTVANIYERTSDVAEWNVYNGTNAGYGQTGTVSSAAGEFIIPDGQMLTARLDSDLSTRTARTGDRFTMTVTSPAQFEGAVIEGHVASASRSGRVTGRSDMSLNFDTISYQGRS